MESNQPPSDGADEPEGRQHKKPKLERATTLAAAAAATEVDGELKLVSSVDGGSVTVTMAAVAQSSTLDPDSKKLDASEPVHMPATLAAISKAVEWIQHKWHCSKTPISDEAQTAFVSKFVTEFAKDCALYAAVYTVADFLGLDPLLSTLLSSLGADGGIGLLRACMGSFPLLASRLAPKLGQHIDEEQTQALLEAVLACDDAATDGDKSAALSWVQLELCDQGLSAEEKNELAAMPPKPMKKPTLEDLVRIYSLTADQAQQFAESSPFSDDVHDEASDPVAERRKELEAKRDAQHLVDKDACLGLTAWARAERERRHALTDSAIVANKAARGIYGLTAEEAKELAAMPPKPMKKAVRADDDDDDADDHPDVYDEANDPDAGRRKELEDKTAVALGVLDEQVADAVQASDLAAAKAAFEKGAALHLYYVGGMRKRHDGANDPKWRGDTDGRIPGDRKWVEHGALPDDCDGIGTGCTGDGERDALPLICTVANNIPMVKWMLDNGADVNACQPCTLTSAGDDNGDGVQYGGANALVYACDDVYAWRRSPRHNVEAVELLCARGADARCTWTPPPSYACGESERGLLMAETQDGPLARCLVRHGADVNAIYKPGYNGGDFGSYWKNVVASGDVAWAAELLTKYAANANWPSESDFHDSFEPDESADIEPDDHDFSTVLMVAIHKQDLSMVRLLLEHGADANKAKPEFCKDSDEEDEGEDDKPGELPLSVALETGNAAIIELLKSKGAKSE
jgi:hypothetical protein